MLPVEDAINRALFVHGRSDVADIVKLGSAELGADLVDLDALLALEPSVASFLAKYLRKRWLGERPPKFQYAFSEVAGLFASSRE